MLLIKMRDLQSPVGWQVRNSSPGEASVF